jgi:ABC-type nitrate/sulfonate/bicarbonate transport system permease component
MVSSVSHQPTRAWQHAHERRQKRIWVIIILLALGSIGLAAVGYFNQVSWAALSNAVLYTTVRLLLAYLIALVLGVGIALLVGWSPFADALFPFFDILQNIPSFALIPFFIYFLGYTTSMIVLFAISSIIWPILFAVLAAIKNAHSDLSDAATLFGATGFRRIPFYLAPLSYPAILTGSIVGIAIGWEAVIGAEIIADFGGFGTFIKNASITGIDQSSLAGMLMILLIVFFLNRAVWSPLLAESNKRYVE